MRIFRPLCLLVALSSHPGCQPEQPGDTAASTSGTDATAAATTGDTTGAPPTTGDATVTTTSTTGMTTGSEPTTGDATTGGALDCSAANTVHIVSPELGIEIHDVAPALDILDMQPAGVHGVAGGQQYFLWRDGDSSDGTLAPGVHDASTYPFHVVLLVGPEGLDCEDDPQQCLLIFGLAGAWDIAAEQPFVGTLHATDLTADENCWVESTPLDTSGCRLSQDRMQACFNITWP